MYQNSIVTRRVASEYTNYRGLTQPAQMKAAISNSIYQLYNGKSQGGTSSSLLRRSTLKSSPSPSLFSNTPGQYVKATMSHMHRTNPMLNANPVYCIFFVVALSQ